MTPEPTPAEPAPLSASRLAELLADQLPSASTVPVEAFELVEHTRALIDAVVLTAATPEQLRAASAQLAKVTAALNSQQREHHVRLVRHEDGRLESLAQAGSGRLNPQSPPLEWLHRPTEPPPGTEPRSVEILARCTFSVRHAGSPDRVHGSVLAGVLDEVTGIAIRAAGARGMTVQLDVSLRGAVPLGVPALIRGRFTGQEGRKAYATGEVTVEGAVVASAQVIYVAEKA
jgi:acyl-coenzyme A thioesterase PaaI-like protein